MHLVWWEYNGRCVHCDFLIRRVVDISTPGRGGLNHQAIRNVLQVSARFPLLASPQILFCDLCYEADKISERSVWTIG
jgi:hypothetical protein